MRIGFDL